MVSQTHQQKRIQVFRFKGLYNIWVCVFEQSLQHVRNLFNVLMKYPSGPFCMSCGNLDASLKKVHKLYKVNCAV